MNSHWTRRARGLRKGVWLISRRPYHQYKVIQCAENLICSAHNLTSLPWWVVIGGTTVILRTAVTLPLSIHQNKIIAQMELLQPLIKEYGEALKHRITVTCRREGKTSDEANRKFKSELRKISREIYSREGCHPLKVTLLPWTQVPLWIVISFALRNMSGANPATGGIPSVPGLSTEGVLWFADLTAPDPLFILPVLLSASNLLNIEVNALRKKRRESRFQNILTKCFRLLSISIGVVASQLPSAMTFYWATSSTYSLAQNLIFMSPRVRRFLKLPKTPSESKTPYRDLRTSLSERTKEFLMRQRKANSQK